MEVIENTYDLAPSDKDDALTILIVDDEELGRLRLESACSALGSAYQIVLAASLPEALKILAAKRVHVVLLDKNVGPEESCTAQNGIEAIPEMLTLQPHLQILMITGSKDLQDAVLATRYGAFGYVTKDTPEALLIANIQKAVQMASLIIEKERLSRSTVSTGEQVNLVGTSSAIRRLKAQVTDIARSERPILLLGETGTGKTTVAKIIHEARKQYLKQKDRPFVAINIAALSPNLVEGELFGSERGAYTGSVASKQGLFEIANSGTLFLDEIGEISPDIQKKLLTVLETGLFRRVGGTKELKSNFRLICATNRNLEEMVQAGTFREDLYLRLSTFPIIVPSLKDRPEDIPELVRSLLPRSSRENRVSVTFEEIPSDYIEYLKKNIPNGNIRGLEQQISRLLVHVPKDRNGRPLLKKWRAVAKPLPAQSYAPETVSIEHLLSKQIDFVSADFPGLTEFLEKIENRILSEVSKKFQKKGDIAKFLKLPKTTTRTKLLKAGVIIKEVGTNV